MPGESILEFRKACSHFLLLIRLFATPGIPVRTCSGLCHYLKPLGYSSGHQVNGIILNIADDLFHEARGFSIDIDLPMDGGQRVCGARDPLRTKSFVLGNQYLQFAVAQSQS